MCQSPGLRQGSELIISTGKVLGPDGEHIGVNDVQDRRALLFALRTRRKSVSLIDTVRRSQVCLSDEPRSWLAGWLRRGWAGCLPLVSASPAQRGPHLSALLRAAFPLFRCHAGCDDHSPHDPESSEKSGVRVSKRSENHEPQTTNREHARRNRGGGADGGRGTTKGAGGRAAAGVWECATCGPARCVLAPSQCSGRGSPWQFFPALCLCSACRALP
jgi:hypothetical protein